MELMSDTIDGLMNTALDDQSRHDALWLILYTYGKPSAAN